MDFRTSPHYCYPPAPNLGTKIGVLKYTPHLLTESCLEPEKVDALF